MEANSIYYDLFLILCLVQGSVISRKFLIKYYEYSFDYPITITNQLTINTHT